MTTRIDSPKTGQVLYGVKSPFKINPTASMHHKRAKGNVIHLTTAKPLMQDVFALFTAIASGCRFAPGEFSYLSRDGVLSITNVSAVSGMIPDPTGTAAIPLYPKIDNNLLLTNFHRPGEVI